MLRHGPDGRGKTWRNTVACPHQRPQVNSPVGLEGTGCPPASCSEAYGKKHSKQSSILNSTLRPMAEFEFKGHRSRHASRHLILVTCALIACACMRYMHAGSIIEVTYSLLSMQEKKIRETGRLACTCTHYDYNTIHVCTAQPGRNVHARTGIAVWIKIGILMFMINKIIDQ